MADKNVLPYANATVMETQRRANLLPSNVPRRTVEDSEIRVSIFSRLPLF